MDSKKRRKVIGFDPLDGGGAAPDALDAALAGPADAPDAPDAAPDADAADAPDAAPEPAADVAPPAAAPAPTPVVAPVPAPAAPASAGAVEISRERDRHPVAETEHHDDGGSHRTFLAVVAGIFVAFATVAKQKDTIADLRHQLAARGPAPSGEVHDAGHGAAHDVAHDAAHDAAAVGGLVADGASPAHAPVAHDGTPEDAPAPDDGAPADPLEAARQDAAALQARLLDVETQLTRATFAADRLGGLFAAVAGVQDDLAAQGRLSPEAREELAGLIAALPQWQGYADALRPAASPERGVLLVVLLREGVGAEDLAAFSFAGAGLSGYGLVGVDLRGVDLTGADLTGADLSGALLDGAKLQGARYDDATSWPDGFDAAAAGALRVDG